MNVTEAARYVAEVSSERVKWRAAWLCACWTYNAGRGRPKNGSAPNNGKVTRSKFAKLSGGQMSNKTVEAYARTWDRAVRSGAIDAPLSTDLRPDSPEPDWLTLLGDDPAGLWSQYSTSELSTDDAAKALLALACDVEQATTVEQLHRADELADLVEPLIADYCAEHYPELEWGNRSGVLRLYFRACLYQAQVALFAAKREIELTTPEFAWTVACSIIGLQRDIEDYPNLPDLADVLPIDAALDAIGIPA